MSESKSGLILPEKYISRSESLLYIAAQLIKKAAYINLIDVKDLHVDMPDATKAFLDARLLSGKNDVLFSSLHKSLFETVGIPYVLDKMHYPIPYIVMGDNLFKGKTVIYLLTKLGAIVSERSNLNKKEATDNLIGKIKNVLDHNNSILAFPYDGRSKDGFIKKMKTTAIQAAIASNTAIIPVDVDYFNVNEEQEFIEYDGKSYTFKAGHFFRWFFKDLGDIQITFGTPIIPSDISSDRNELAKYVREQSMNLVKIYARNIVAYSMMQEEVMQNPKKLEYIVKKNLEKVSSQSHKFIDFTLDATLDELLFKAQLSGKDSKAIRLYGNYMSHYVEGMYDKC